MRAVELTVEMDVREHFRRRMQNIGRSAELVKNFSVFDFDYVPPEPLMREEAVELIDEMLRFKVTGIPTHHFIIGSRGCGKTMTMKFLGGTLAVETGIPVHYANCRQHNTSYKILAHLLGVQPRGVSLAELFETFEAKTDSQAIVLLDEIELMSPKDRNREILFMLSRSRKRYMVISLSNNPRIVREIDMSTRSSLQPVSIHFRNYDAEQILNILRERARQGLQSCDEAQLAEIAALTVRRTHSDVRVAIKTLFYSVTRSGKSLEESFERARRDVMVDMIADLSDSALMTLRAVATSETDFARDIYGRYRRICQGQGERPVSYVHFCSNLSHLQCGGIIALVSTKVGRSYPNRVLLTFDRATVEQICRLRFDQ